MSENHTPFESKPEVIYEKDSFVMVKGRAITNKDEKFCIGLRANGFPKEGYVIFPPQLNLDLLRNLLGEKGSKNEAIMKALKEIL